MMNIDYKTTFFTSISQFLIQSDCCSRSKDCSEMKFDSGKTWTESSTKFEAGT